MGSFSQGRTNVFATLIGNDDSARRIEFSKALLGQSSSRATVTANPSSPIDTLLSGYVINCSSSPSTSLLNASLDPLPNTKPRIAHCPSGPHEILRLIRDVGFDLIVEEWSQTCSTYGIALDFDFPPTSSKSCDIGTNLYLPEHEYSFSPLSTSSLAPNEQNHPFGPSPPTRSYVHHLLLAHEMTSHVILALHNQTVMLNFLESIRSVLSRPDGEEKFKEMVERFEEVYRERDETGEYAIVREGRKAWKVVEKARGKGSMKEKVLELQREQEESKIVEEKEKVLTTAVLEEGRKELDQ